ncbi:hypothetical protein [Amycolatopsis sp. NPDC059657]|uniref:hypothetical protein n=1 Tax=Amycolatopsis sp. NPDC059657 TaxID=3346899 RepID=UPI00366F5268
MRRSRARRRIAALLLTAPLLAACGWFDPDPVPTTTSAPPVCAQGYPYTLQLIPETLPELLAQSGLTVCADSTSSNLLVRNDSKAVWIIDRPVGLHWPLKDLALNDVDLFRKIRGTAPGLTVEPGQSATITATPADLHLKLDVFAAAGWQTITAIKDSIEKKAVGAFFKLVAGNSTAKEVIIECGTAGYNAGQAIAKAPQQDPAEAVKSALGLIPGVRTCFSVVKANEARTGELKLASLAEHVKQPAWTMETNSIGRAALKQFALRFRIP